MAETTLGLNGVGVVKMVLRSASAGFAFAETVLASVEPILTKDGPLLTAAARAAERVGSTGVGVVTACLVFTSALVSLGTGILLASMVMRLLTGVEERRARLPDTAAGVYIAAGAVATGTLAGYMPAWAYIMAQFIMVVVVYSYANINDMTTVLLIVFTTLYASVLCGRLGILTGLFTMGITISFLCALRKALSEKVAHAPKPDSGVRLFVRLRLYAIVVATLGFLIGWGAGGGGGGDGESEAEVASMLESVLRVGVLSAGLLGAALGTTAVVGLGPKGAGRVAVGAAVTSSAALRLILPACPVLGERAIMGGMLGAATAAGVSLGAASVAAKEEFRARHTTLLVLCPVVVGSILALRGLALTTVLLTTTELITVTLVAVGAFILGAPKSPFHTRVNLRGGLLTGVNLMEGIAMETITGAAAPLGAGALGAAVLGTAALGRLGTAGVVVALLVALVKTLCGTVRESPSPPPRNEHRD